MEGVALNTFNRTILELKLKEVMDKEEKLQPFNRTILELKHVSPSPTSFSIAAFNRTILELKHAILIAFVGVEIPSTVPFWN